MDILGMWNTMTNFGKLICVVIGAITFIYFVLAANVRSFYADLRRSVETARKGKLSYVSDIIEDFEYIAESSKVENINTDAIVCKHLPPKIERREASLDSFPTIVIVLGILGTFTGLAEALQNFNQLTEQREIALILSRLKVPISSMGTAFITSIAGIVASLLMNVLGKIRFCAYASERDNFFNVILNKLDNEILPSFRKDNNETKLAEVFEQAINTLTDVMQKGFDKFQMLETVNIQINDTGEKLQKSMSSLEKGVANFEKSISVFNDLAKHPFGEIEDCLKNMNAILAENTIATKELNERIVPVIGGLVSAYDAVEQTLKSRTHAERENIEAIADLKNSVHIISTELNLMSDKFATDVGRTIREQIMRVTKEISSIMGASISDVNMRTKDLQIIADKLKERIEEISAK
ncbi:hypothetical protein AGMMS49975_16340 [Clostridia bacterium]|nr:hypothetical protein AGMMS49975_16340 [Clostridia bacterium]